MENINKEKDVVQKEGLDSLRNNEFRAMLVIPTGFGKTKIMIDALKEIYQNGMSILYTCDNKKLRDEDFPNELKKWDASFFLSNMERMCYQSAYKLENIYYDILLCDEADYMCTKEYIKLLKHNKFKYIIAVSATLEKEKREIIEQYIPIVYDKIMADLDGKGIVNKANLYAVNYLLSPEENRKYLAFNDAFKAQLHDGKRNNFAINLIKQGRKNFLGKLLSSQKICNKLMKKLYLENETNKILIFCLLSQQADDICKFSYHSKNAKDNENLRLFDEGLIRILSVVGKIDRGVNLNGVNKIIFEAPFGSKTKLTQKSGRGRRLHVDDILDVYFLIPYYRTRFGEIKPTVVERWVQHSTKDLGVEIKNYQL